MPRSGLVRHAEPCHDERQDSADDRTEVYQEGLYHVALCLLRIVKHVGHQRPEGLHRDVERQIHEQQDESPHGERGEGEQFGAVGHEHQRQRRDQRPAQMGDAAAPARPKPSEKAPRWAGRSCRPAVPARSSSGGWTSAPSDLKMLDVLEFWSEYPICTPRKPKLRFQICQNESLGLVISVFRLVFRLYKF